MAISTAHAFLGSAPALVPFLLGLTSIELPPHAAAAGNYAANIAAWRSEHAAGLSAPDGWLSLIGLHWLHAGSNTVGAAGDNAIRLSAGPLYFGEVTLGDANGIIFEPAQEVRAYIDGQLVTGRTPLRYDSAKPSVVQCDTVSLYVIKRGDKLGLRVKDSASPRRRNFAGLDWYPVDPAWRIDAEWVPFDPVQEIPIANILGQTTLMPVPGKAVFTHQGKTYELFPVEEGAGGPLFFIIYDATSGKETYGASRFLYAERPRDGRIVLDFNRAENPPCAFTPFATFPLPPRENRLPIAITAGERNYRGGSH